MQVSNNVNSNYYTSYESKTNVKGISSFTINLDGVLEVKETEEPPGFIGEVVDYEKFHKAWMSQGANTPFSYTENKGLNKEENSISLVPGMAVRLNNGFMISINDSMVQALGDFMDNAAAEESTAVAGALNHLIKVANGQIPMNMFYSRNQDNSAYAKIGLQAFGIDTSRPFTINEKTFHFDNEGQIRLGSGNLSQYMSDSADEKSRILELMDLFDNLSGTGDYFNPEYWKENIKNVYEASSQNVGASEKYTDTVPKEFAGMSCMDLLNSQYARNKIPTVNQIISSKSPDDGELYRVYFTNDRISCNHADGKRAWEVEINDEQQAEKVKEFFEGYTPNDNWANNEYCSSDNMGMAVLKTFWLDLLKQ